MKKCPICAGPLDQNGYCSICEFSADNVVEVEATEVKQEETQTVNVNKPKQKQPKILSVFGMMILLVINACVCATIVNICLETSFWAHYVTIGLLTVFLITFSFCTKNAKKITVRLRSAVFVLTLIACIFMIILRIIGQDFSWIWQYYLPILILVSNFILIIMLLLRKITISGSLITSVVNFVLTLCPLIFMIVLGVTLPIKVIIISAFAISLLLVINMLFIKILQWKNILTEKFIK